MKRLYAAAAAALLSGASGTAFAQAGETSTAGPMPVRGNVPALCSSGSLPAADGAFELGVLVDTSTGFLLPNLSAPPKTLAGAFCSSKSSITVTATPLSAVNMTAAAPTGFSRTVHYTASANGWTSSPAVFATGAASNPGAMQERSGAFTGDIVVNVGSFATAGGNSLRMVADTAYQGLVTVTLAVVE